MRSFTRSLLKPSVFSVSNLRKFSSSIELDKIVPLAVIVKAEYEKSKIDPNTKMKQNNTQILTYNELFESSEVSINFKRKLESGGFINFRGISDSELMIFSRYIYPIQGIYRLLDNKYGQKLEKKLFDQGLLAASDKFASAGTAFFINNKLLLTANHTIDAFKKCEEDDTENAAELIEVKIITPKGGYYGNGNAVYRDTKNDFAILHSTSKCLEKNYFNLEAFDVSTNKPKFILFAGYYAERGTIDSLGMEIYEKDIIDGFGKRGELAFCSLSQEYVDGLTDKEKLALMGNDTSIIQPPKVGQNYNFKSIFNPILGGHSGSPVILKDGDIISGMVVAELHSKSGNFSLLFTEDMIKKINEIKKKY